jgi:MFS family permease
VGGVRRYLAVLGAPHAKALVLAAFVARLPIAMTPLALLLLVRDSTGDYAAAGAVTAVFALCEGIAAPVQGRIIDRFGQTPSLLATATLFPLAVWGVALAAEEEASTPLLAALAALAGLVLPPVMATMRALWPDVVRDPKLVETAYALEASLQELFFFSGPLLVALAVTLASPAAAVVAAGVFGLVGTLAFAASPVSRARGPAARPAGGRRRAGALAGNGMRTVVGTGLLCGCAFGTIEVALPAFADAQGTRGAAGVLLAAFALGSFAGGLAYGARTWRASLDRRYPRALAAFAAGLVPVLLAPSLPVMLAAALLAGATIAPIFATGYAIVARIAPAGTITEAYAWISTSIVLGVAVGNATAGALVEASSHRGALLAGLTVALLAALVARRRRATLSGAARPAAPSPARAPASAGAGR